VRTLDLDGLRIAYEQAGEGPPLVLLHGALSDSRAWRAQIEALAAEFTVVAWDAPGAGRSSDPPDGFGMAGWAEALAGLLDAVRLGPAHVAGISWGGSVALELYRRHPDAAASLILADTYAGWKGSLSPVQCAERLDQAVRASHMSPDELTAIWLPQLLSTGAQPEFARELATIMADFHPAGARAMAQAMAEADLTGVLPCIRVPTLLLWGERDARSPLGIAEAMRAAIPGAHLTILPDAGHDSNVEQPGRFTAAVREFCRSVPIA
jgi:pimeloyl-ACP methyl ester carboxylesterase